jgi:hypothetical protein
MPSIIGINEATNPVLIIIPLILMSLSGYAIGRVVSLLLLAETSPVSLSVRQKHQKIKHALIDLFKPTYASSSSSSNSSTFLRDLINGNIILNFLFISGFIIFGILIYQAREYFSVFTYALTSLSIVGIYILVKELFIVSLSRNNKNASIKSLHFLLLSVYRNSHVFVLFGIALFATLIAYHGLVVYYHPIFSEYDSLYLFLPISKSILLGNGLNHNFYTGADAVLRYPPFSQALNAWLIHSFGWSSMRLFPLYFVFFSSVVVYSVARRIISYKMKNKIEEKFLALIASCVFLISPCLLIVSSRFSLQQDLAFIFFLSASFYFLSQLFSGRQYNSNDNIEKKNDLGPGEISSNAAAATAATIHTASISYGSHPKSDASNFISACIASKKIRLSIILLIISLSLMPLTREVGLMMTIAIFFLLPAMKFTKDNSKMRVLFTALSFLPLYLLTLYDLFHSGFTYTITIRLIVLLLANLAIFYISSQVSKSQSRFTKNSLFTKRNIKYLVPMVIPLIFIGSNMLFIGGLYPTLIFYGKFSQHLALYRDVFGISNKIYLGLPDALLFNVPRIDILFISVAVGSIFLFFKLWGFGKLIYEIKNNNQYSLVLVLFIILLIIWSYLLSSDYRISGVRHVIYFLPLLSIIFILGAISSEKGKGRPGSSSSSSSSLSSSSSDGVSLNRSDYKLYYYYAIIVLASFYFLTYNIYIWNYDNHFGSFWIDPSKPSIMTLNDWRLAAAVVAILIILTYKQHTISHWFEKFNLQKFSSLILLLLLGIQIYVLSFSSGSIAVVPHSKIDQQAPLRWEHGVFQPIDYLKNAQAGNILSLRAPAIPFFTNRTDFDLYSTHALNSISPLLETKDLTLLKKKLSEMAIRYIVLPNEKSSLYYLEQHLAIKHSNFIETINTDPDFHRIRYDEFDVYKYDPTHSGINLNDKQESWKPFINAQIVKSNSSGSLYNNALNIVVKTGSADKLFNRVVLDTQINLAKKPLLLSMDYASSSKSGNATFYVEIRSNQDNNIHGGRNNNTIENKKILWGRQLDNTDGKFRNEAFVIPGEIVHKPLELRLYIITLGTGEHTLSVKNTTISYP